jgi:hypothetical protein
MLSSLPSLIPFYFGNGLSGVGMSTARPVTPFFFNKATSGLEHRNLSWVGAPWHAPYIRSINDGVVEGYNCDDILDRYRVETIERVASGKPDSSDPSWSYTKELIRTVATTWNYGAKTLTFPEVESLVETGALGGAIGGTVSEYNTATYSNSHKVGAGGAPHFPFIDDLTEVTLSEQISIADIIDILGTAVGLGDVAFDEWVFQGLSKRSDCIATKCESLKVNGFIEARGSYRTDDVYYFNEGITINTEEGIGSLWNGNFLIHCIIRTRKNLPRQLGAYVNSGGFVFIRPSFTNLPAYGTCTETLSENIDHIYIGTNSYGNEIGASAEVEWTSGFGILESYPWSEIPDFSDPYNLNLLLFSLIESYYKVLSEMMFISRTSKVYRITLTTETTSDPIVNVFTTDSVTGRFVFSSLLDEESYYSTISTQVTLIERDTLDGWVIVASKDAYDQYLLDYDQWLLDYADWIMGGSLPGGMPIKPEVQINPIDIIGSDAGNPAIQILVVGKQVSLVGFGFIGFDTDETRWRVRDFTCDQVGRSVGDIYDDGCGAGIEPSTMSIETRQAFIHGHLGPLEILSYSRIIAGIVCESEESKAFDVATPAFWGVESLTDTVKVSSLEQQPLDGRYYPPTSDVVDPRGEIVSEAIVTLTVEEFAGKNGIDWSAVMTAEPGNSIFFEGYRLSFVE